jgi:phosphatidylserine decarboxylase
MYGHDTAQATAPPQSAATARSIVILGSMARLIDRIVQREDINFALTNRIPKRAFTLFMGWFSQIEHPLVCRASLRVWRTFAGPLDLHDAKKAEFSSLHDCFIRELKPGARPIDPAPEILVSPCDGIVGAAGGINGSTLIQAKDSTYALEDLLGDAELTAAYRNGRYVTLRLTSTMYHRFHAPYDCEADGVMYIPGETWNVNPPALNKIERLFCRNERAIVPLRLGNSRESVVLVPVAAILVASIHFEFVDVPLNLKYRGPRYLPGRASFKKGDEMGHFRHGSTIVVIATGGLELCEGIREGARVRVGQALFRHR